LVLVAAVGEVVFEREGINTVAGSMEAYFGSFGR
jgi:hypothetical protein